jgi:hypothetical protein
MALTQQLQVGDRVRMIRKTEGILKGTYGTVVRVLGASNCCDVQFDGYPWPRLVYCGDLALVEQEASVGQS